jgi:hypothetical protein
MAGGGLTKAGSFKKSAVKSNSNVAEGQFCTQQYQQNSNFQ